MITFCKEHNTVTTWGCRECLRENLRRVTDEEIEKLKSKLDCALSHQAPHSSSEGER